VYGTPAGLASHRQTSFRQSGGSNFLGECLLDLVGDWGFGRVTVEEVDKGSDAAVPSPTTMKGAQ
jgi:hypothetical protein